MIRTTGSGCRRPLVSSRRLASTAWMRDAQGGVAGLTVLGVILLVLGLIAVAVAPEIMNYSEVNTLRGVGGGAAGLGLILLAVGLSKKK